MKFNLFRQSYLVTHFIWFLFATSFSCAQTPKTAVVVVDMQDSFLERLLPSINDSLKSEILSLLEWAHGEEVPILAFEYFGWGPTSPKLRDYMNKMTNVTTLVKRHDNGFYGEPGNQAVLQLRKWGVDNLIVAGVNALYCVKQTAQGGLDKGYFIWTAGTVVANGESPEYPHLSWWIFTKQFQGYYDLPALFENFLPRF